MKTKILEAIFYENGKLSLGRLMLVAYFTFLMVILVISFITSKTVGDTFLEVFKLLLYYAFGVKVVGISRKVSDYLTKQKPKPKDP